MTGIIDTLAPFPRATRMRTSIREDLGHLLSGRMDLGSFVSPFQRHRDPVEVRTTSLVPDGVRVSRAELVAEPRAFTDPVLVGGVWRDRAWGMQRRVWREIRRTHNTRLQVGRDQLQRIADLGDIGTDLAGFAIAGSATAPTATTFTSGTTLPTGAAASGNTGLQGHGLFVANAISADAFTNPVFGVIVSNTSSVVTVDQWYAVPITGAAGTTPASASAGLVVPGAWYAAWVALSTSTTTPAATDVTRTADGLWGDGTSTGTATEATTNGLSRAYCGSGSSTSPTFPAAGEYQFGHTWTYTGATSVTIGKVVLFNSLAAAGTIPFLEALLNATATVSLSGDTITLSSWTVNYGA